ncbi:ATP-binding protein [Alkalibacter rhizosphaerae]|uniref:histidine kinase n=1 Tax=Alkalibacter rhizosphaerae TaxID=2815577 RepID=A0A974XDT0_9FIRM|nr:ATP-binding protein [Alkalibacter rhizosphaerae]QSX07978.1 ATP-binding protein [Alkalibacter rhizosphaerae]
MKELSLHINDIIENALKAEATLVKLTIVEEPVQNKLLIKISDNGKGMPKEFRSRAMDPFTTSRTTRPVGLGLSLFEASAKRSGGSLKLLSKENVGTVVLARFQYDHIDRAPLGNMVSTITAVILGLNKADFIYVHRIGGETFRLDTREIRQMLGDKVDLNDMEVIRWVRGYVREGLAELEDQR